MNRLYVCVQFLAEDAKFGRVVGVEDRGARQHPRSALPERTGAGEAVPDGPRRRTLKAP